MEQKHMPLLPEATLYDTPAGLKPRYTSMQMHEYARLTLDFHMTTQNHVAPHVPPDYQSKLPPLLRALAAKCGFAPGSVEQKLLCDAAAEIEGSEEAFAMLVGDKVVLRDKLANAQRNMRAALELVPRKSL